MAMTLTPGYDFTVNEVPTKTKLQTMLAGASITGIPLAQIDTNLVGIKIGDTSVSLPGEGWLWKDDINSVWIKNRFGRCKLFRANWGGWETNRYIVNQTKKPGGLPEAIGISFVDLISASGDSGNPIFCHTDVDSPNGRYSLKCTDTPTSGSYCRCIGRGGHVVTISGTINEFQPYYVVRNNLGIAGQAVEPFPNSVTFRGARGLTICKTYHEAEHENIYWHFGVRIMQD